jgi:DNA-binding NtrC family response regulator
MVPATILLIDDDAAMRTILRMSLTALGYLVLSASEGEEALQLAHDHPEIGLVMLDVVMPGLSGKKLAEQLKIHLPKAPVLFCSGHPASAMSGYDINPPSDHFLQKPCRAPELKQKVEALLSAS